MKINALTKPTEELKLRFPWTLTCKLACKALILGVDFDGAVEQGLVRGMAKKEAEDESFRVMRSINKSTPKE